MSELDHRIRSGLERLSDAEGAAAPPTFERLVARRRLRRARKTALVLVPVVALLAVGIGVVSSQGDDGEVKVATGGGRLPGLTVTRTEVVGGEVGTARVILEFDGPLPSGDVEYLEDITAPSGVAYTTQPAGAVHVCESVHSFPPPAEGTVDVLIPASWFAEGEGTRIAPLERVGNPAKFVSCGPYDGYVQYSIWGPVSADRADVTVTVDRGRSRLTVDIDPDADRSTTSVPPELGDGQADAAEAIVTAFLDDLRQGDLSAAAQRWTGYPELGPDAPASERVPFLEDLMADSTFARILRSDTGVFVSASWGRTSAAPVVTVLAHRDGDAPPAAVSFLVGMTDEQGDPGALWIHRLPAPAGDIELNVPLGSFVETGQAIVVPGVPVEGGARAYVNGNEVSVEIDHERATMTIMVPGIPVEGDIAVTLSTATPELPGVQAFAFTVRSP